MALTRCSPDAGQQRSSPAGIELSGIKCRFARRNYTEQSPEILFN